MIITPSTDSYDFIIFHPSQTKIFIHTCVENNILSLSHKQIEMTKWAEKKNNIAKLKIPTLIP